MQDVLKYSFAQYNYYTPFRILTSRKIKSVSYDINKFINCYFTLIADATEADVQTIKFAMPDFTSTAKIKTYLGLSENGNPEPVSFQDNDPLGMSAVPTVTQESQVKNEYQMRYLGNQASLLTTSRDRIQALKYLTTSIHILLSRSIILSILSQLAISANPMSLAQSLEMIGLSDICKVVRLMTLVAMNRVEVTNVHTRDEIRSSYTFLLKNISQLSSPIPAANGCLNNLSIIISALAQNNPEASKLVVNMCTKDLIMSALGSFIPKCGFAVTQALVNILSTHGGCSLMDLPKEEVPMSPVSNANNNGPLTLENALSAYVLSPRITQENRQWAAEQLFKCIATKIQMLSGNNIEQINLSDILSSIDQKDVIYLEGHENRVSVLAWFSKKCLLASSGFDGTVRVWTYDCKPQLCLEHTFVFHESMNVYGTELQGKLIGHIKWSPTGDYIAAAMENIINIWPVSMSNEETDGCKEWFIDDQHEFVTCMTWPKYKHEDVNKKDYLLVGRIDGTVSLISVYRGNKEIETLINCSLSHGKFLVFV